MCYCLLPCFDVSILPHYFNTKCVCLHISFQKRYTSFYFLLFVFKCIIRRERDRKQPCFPLFFRKRKRPFPFLEKEIVILCLHISFEKRYTACAVWQTYNLTTIMKKTIAFVALSMAAFTLSSCGGLNTRPIGTVYADVADPVAATSSSGARVGEATSTSYLGVVALGDSSIEAAKRNGGISSVSSVDVKRKNILGIITSYTTVVRGN